MRRRAPPAVKGTARSAGRHAAKEPPASVAAKRTCQPAHRSRPGARLTIKRSGACADITARRAERTSLLAPRAHA